MNQLRASDFRRMGRETMSGNFGTVILVLLIQSVLLSALGATVVGSIIVAGPLSVGVAYVMLALTRRESTELGDMFSGFRSGFADNLVAGLLVSVFTALWSLLFVIPGIVKGLSYSMTFYIMADNPGTPAMQAIERSQEMMRGHKWQLFCLQLSFIGWYLLIGLTCGLAAIYVAPYMASANAAFYQKLKEETEPQTTQTAEDTATDEQVNG